jgi:hypothetical protein
MSEKVLTTLTIILGLTMGVETVEKENTGIFTVIRIQKYIRAHLLHPSYHCNPFETFYASVLAHKINHKFVDLLSLREKYHLESHMLYYLREYFLKALSISLNSADTGTFEYDDLFIQKLDDMPAYIKEGTQIRDLYSLKHVLDPVRFYKEIKLIMQRVNKLFYAYYNEELLKKVKILYAVSNIDPNLYTYLNDTKILANSLVVKSAILQRWQRVYPNYTRKEGYLCFFDVLSLFSEGEYAEINRIFTLNYDNEYNKVNDDDDDEHLKLKLGTQVYQYIDLFVSVLITFELRQEINSDTKLSEMMP